MSRFYDTVHWVKNHCKINNVYSSAKLFLFVFGLLGAGANRICRRDGAYTLRNTRFSMLVAGAVVFNTAWVMYKTLSFLFNGEERPLNVNIYYIIDFMTTSLRLLIMTIGCIMTHIHCKNLDRVFRIINNIDSQLDEVNIRVKHWQITLKVTVLVLITADYAELRDNSYIFIMVALRRGFRSAVFLLIPVLVVISIHLFLIWVILFLVIIQERFVCLNKLLQQNATITNIEIMGERNRCDNYLLRRISLGRHVHEQLAEVVRLFSDTCRYTVTVLLMAPILEILCSLLPALYRGTDNERNICSMLTHFSRIVVLILISQANQNERRVLNSRLRHLVAHETNREIIRQVQLYIMYNAYATTGIIDFQFTNIDNILMLTMIDVIVSNVLIMYSYFR